MLRLISAFLTAALLIAALTTLSLATEIPPGPVTGNWYASENPYNINGEIYIPANYSLYIHPGVEVVFQGHYKLTVDDFSFLEAVGSETDSILFTAANITTGWGGIRLIDDTHLTSHLSYCIIQYGKAIIPDNYGGGIFCGPSTQPVIEHCAIRMNWADDQGGGIYSYNASPTISNCKISQNQAHSGGGIYCLSNYSGTTPTITNCIIEWNFAINAPWAYGGGLYCSGANNPNLSTLIENCIIAYNGATSGGNGIWTDGYISIINCTIYGNEEPGIYCGGYDLNGENNIIWDIIELQPGGGNFNCNYSDIMGGWPGTGNIDMDPIFVAGPDGDYYLSQIAAGQSLQSSCVNSGNPASSMIGGTTRTDGVQDSGIVDMGFHYPFPPPPPPPATITLIPYGIPIQIPPGGGAFNYNIAATNTQTFQVICTVWCNATLPNGNIYGPTMGPTTIALPGSASINRDRTQMVPNIAPPGTYIYHAYIGTYPDSAWDTDAFTFTKLGNGDGGSGAGGWANMGEEFDVGARHAVPVSGSGATPTMEVIPNPFNPTTAISFELRAASFVHLKVYDTAGRLVETLVDGWREAGEHRVVFNGAGLAAGVYLYRLEASGSGASPTMISGKMALLK